MKSCSTIWGWLALLAGLGMLCSPAFQALAASPAGAWYLPIRADKRQDWQGVRLTAIGAFGLPRKTRPQVPAHYHTGVDFCRPQAENWHEPVFAASRGLVISQRSDGPFAQIIIEHPAEKETLWTVYEHVAGIQVAVGDTVSPLTPIARFMNAAELQQHGWQFNHLHFEILKRRPRAVAPAARTPMRRFQSYNLECYTQSDLGKYYYDPQSFLVANWQKQ